MKFIGIDIGKSSFVAAFPTASGYQTKTYPNSVAGIKKFISAISPLEHHCVMEVTGNYGFLLLYLLHQGRIAASLVNPKQVKHFARMMMTVTKTDDKDACMIAMYGEKMNPPVYKMPSEAIIMLKQKKTVIRQLKKQLVATGNLRESLMVLPHKDHNSMQALNKTISFLSRQIESLESELANIAISEFEKQIKALTSIKGVGITLATALIVSTGGFTYFDNAKQLSRFIGICPTYYQSGTSVNIKGRINRNGDTSLRSLLYVASWTAIRYNSACRECYLRLKANGKPSKVALISVANKLVRQAFAIATADSSYIDGFCSSLKTNPA
jgi:transposase